MLGVLNVSAQGEEIALTADMFFNWNGYGADATATTAATVEFNVGNNAELGGGNVVCGTGTVDHLIYADLTGSTKIMFEGTPGLPLRLLMNRQESNSGPLTEKQVAIGEDGKAEVDLSDLPYVHINAIKVNWGDTKGTVSSIKYVKAAAGIKFDFNASNHATSSSSDTAGDITADEVNTVNDVVMTITPNPSGTPNRYWGTSKGPQLRMYGGTMTIVAPDGKAITTAIIDNAKWNDKNTFNGEIAAKGEWAGNSTNLVLAVAGNTQMNSVVVTLAEKNDATTTYVAGGEEEEEGIRSWDFTKWSYATVANLIADAKASKTSGWSDVEKKADAEADAEPTDATKDNCFWLQLDAAPTDGALTANGVVIEELKGLKFTDNATVSSRNIAIAVNYPSTSLGNYAGGSYFWVGGKSRTFTIPNVAAGSTITMEVESHKISEGRGVKLMQGDTQIGDVFNPTTKETHSWNIENAGDVAVVNTNGCHIYKITITEGGDSPSILEAANFAAFKALEKGTEALVTLKDAYVTAVSGSNAYVQDASGALYFYNTGLALEAGKVLNGTVIGKLDIYNTLPEFTKTAGTNAEGFTVTDGTATAKAVTVAEALTTDNISMLVKVAGATITEEEGKFYAVDGENKIQIYDQFKVLAEDFTYPAKATITGIVGMYKGTPQLYPLTANSIVEEAGYFTFDGVAYIIDTESGKFVAAGHDWGTRGIINEIGLDLTFATNPETKMVTIDTRVFNGNDKHFLGSNLYMDSPAAEWGLLEQEFGFYITDGTKYLSVDANDNLELSDAPHLWILVTPEGVKAQRLEDLETASAANPVDATWLIQDANFNRGDNRKSAWTGDDFSIGGKETNTNAEKWGGNSQTFDIKQTVEAPNGLYKITWNGFYRYNNTGDNTNDVAIAAHADGTEVINSFVYLNDKDYALTSIADDAASAALEGKLPFSQGEATDAFEKGLYEQEAEVTITDGKLTIGIKKTEHLGTDWTVWDNFRLTYLGVASNSDEAVKEAPTGWILAVTNGNLAGDDVSSYFAKEAPSTTPTGATIVDGAGVNNSRGIVVKSQDKVKEAWDTQFWIKVNEPLASGTKIHVEFDYKADKAGKVGTQAHGEPGNYQHFVGIGDVTFDTEWKHFDTDFEVSGDMATGNGGKGLISFAFNLNDIAEANTFYFDNFGVWYQKPAPVENWADLIVNGDMEGESMECFYVTEQGVGGPFVAVATEGIGKDGSKAVKIQSADNPGQDWDTQFFIRLPYELPAGTKFKVSFDYKADKAGDFETQSHNEPGQYIHWACCGSGSFTTDWQTYTNEGNVPSECNGDQADGGYLKNFQTIAFNLAKNKVATEFIIDNVKFEVEESIVATLTKSPAENPTFYPVGIMTVNAEKLNGQFFDLQGRRVVKPAKGLYIINGKKAVIK